MKRLRPLVYLLALVALLLALLYFRSPHEPGVPEEPQPSAGVTPGDDGAFVSFADEVMATTVRVTVPRARAGAGALIPPEDAAETVFRIFREVDRDMSEWKEGSPLAEVNRRAGGEPVPVPRELLEVVRRGLEIGELTGGAFDVTWAALWDLWEFPSTRSPGRARVPPARQIERRAALVDFRRVELDPEARTLRLSEAGMQIGLGGIAKGYALERSARALLRRGLESFLLVVGGQVYAAGPRDGAPWRVGVRDPRGGPEETIATIPAVDVSVSTSGDYERFFLLDGVRYHHILDPRTGRPARGLRSATVVAVDPVLADGLSTGIFVLGPDEGLDLAERLEEVEALLVDADGEILTTSGLEAP